MHANIPTGLLFFSFVLAVEARAEWSANLGWSSEYFYRGIFQAESSAFTGVDVETKGFYAGAWATDVGDGLETDLYLGYQKSLADFELSVGFTGYYYTGDFDDRYQELNLGGAFRFASVDLAFGEYGNFSGPTQEYTFYAITFEHRGLYGKYAGFAHEFSGNYIEVGYSTEFSSFDVSVAAIFANDDLAGKADESLIFTVSRSFDLGK